MVIGKLTMAITRDQITKPKDTEDPITLRNDNRKINADIKKAHFDKK